MSTINNFMRLIHQIKLIFSFFFFATSYAHSDEMHFRIADNGGNCSQCVWTVAEGQITENTPKKFEEFLNNNTLPKRIIFNSPSGNLVGGLRLGLFKNN